MTVLIKMRIVLFVVICFTLLNWAEFKPLLEGGDMRQENLVEKEEKQQGTVGHGNMFMRNTSVGRSLSNIPPKKLCNGQWIDPCKVCKLPQDYGFCRAYVIRYNFDYKSESCNRMGYSGCLGNRNNFAKKQDCMDCCAGSLAQCE